MFSFLLKQDKDQKAISDYQSSVDKIHIDTAKRQLESTINALIAQTDKDCIKALFDSFNSLQKLKIDGKHKLWLYGCQLEVSYDQGKLINLKIIE